jgi:hypothetical protein
MDTMKTTWQKLVSFATALAVSGCGAPTKSAGDVKSLFEGPGTSLEDKVIGLCDKLKANSEPPTLEGVNLNVDGCKDAGLAALNLKEIKEFSFIGLEGDVPDKDAEKIINRSVRAQVWLNKSIIGMAGAIAKKLQQNKEAGDNAGFVSLPSSGETEGLGDIATPDVEVLEEPAFDLEKMSFSTAIHLKVTGAVEVDNVIRVAGGLIDNKFAVVVTSDGEQPYEKSLIRDFSAMILMVPHASDIYLDLFVNINLHNPGLESLIRSQITSFLGSSLKGVIDGFLSI